MYSAFYILKKWYTFTPLTGTLSRHYTIPFITLNKATKYQYSQKDFEGYTSNNDWDFYYGCEGEVKRIELIFDTIAYFETGERKGFIEPLAALNLIYYHNSFIVKNNKKPYSNIEVLQNLPFNSEIKHVLFGMIIFWFGGSTYNSDWSGGKFQDYNVPQNLDRQDN